MDGGTTAYDLVTYPSGAFWPTHPDHLAAIARLHGLTPPPVETARVLDIGAGDGMNVLAMAELLPRARFHSIDLAAQPVARGQRIAAVAGLDNVTVAVGDIMDAAAIQGPYDYVVTHGVYAWVPPAVREALMMLIARVLAPDGIAFVSYNALPGGYFRRALRDMTLHAIGDVADPEARADAARQVLRTYAERGERDTATIASLRVLAGQLAERSTGALLHDELGECYEPQAFADVVRAGAAHGLAFLNDAEAEELDDGFPEGAPDEAGVIHAVQARDYREVRFFHRTLFVHAPFTGARTPSLTAIRELYLSAQCERLEGDAFQSGNHRVTLTDPALVAALTAAGAAWPKRIRVGDVIDDEMRLRAIYRLFAGGIILLHALPEGAAEPGERPRASALARALVAMDEPLIVTLDLRMMALDDPDARAFLTMLDGTRDRDTLATEWGRLSAARTVPFEQALARMAASGLIVG